LAQITDEYAFYARDRLPRRLSHKAPEGCHRSYPLFLAWAERKAGELGVVDVGSLIDELDPSLSFSENKQLFFNALGRRRIEPDAETLSEAEREEQYQTYLLNEFEKRGFKIVTPEMEKSLRETYEQTKEILTLQIEVDRLKGSLQDMRSRLPAQELEYREKLEELKRKEGDLEAWQRQLTAWQFNGKTRVRFLYAMPKFLGFDMKPYGPYGKGDVAELPRDNAEALLKRGLVDQVASNSTAKNNDLVKFKVKNNNEEKKRPRPPVKVVSIVKDVPDTKKPIRKKVPEKIEYPEEREEEERNPENEFKIAVGILFLVGICFLATASPWPKGWGSYLFASLAFIMGTVALIWKWRQSVGER